MGKRWTKRRSSELLEAIGRGSVEDVDALLSELGMETLPGYDQGLSEHELTEPLGRGCSVAVYRRLRELGMPLPHVFDRLDQTFEGLRESGASPDRIKELLVAMLDDGYRPMTLGLGARASVVDQTGARALVLGEMPFDRGLAERMAEAGFFARDASTRGEEWALMLVNDRADAVSFLVGLGGKPPIDFVVGPDAGVDAAMRLAESGARVPGVEIACPRDVVLACAAAGAAPLSSPSPRTATSGPLSSEDRARGQKALCATLDCELIGAFLRAGTLTEPDLEPARASSRHDVIELFSSYRLGDEWADTDRVAEMATYVPDTLFAMARPVDPDAILGELERGARVDWRKVLPHLLDAYLYREGGARHAVFGTSAWPRLLGAVLDEEGADGVEVTVPMKARALGARAVDGAPSSAWWEPEDAEVYGLLLGHGAELRADATPEAVLFHCAPDVRDILFGLNGWCVGELPLTRGKVTYAVANSRNADALRLVTDALPKLVNPDGIQAQLERRYEYKPPISEAVEEARAKLGAPAAAPKERKKTPAQLAKEASAALWDGDAGPLLSLLPALKKVSKTALSELLVRCAGRADGEATDALLRSIEEAGRVGEVSLDEALLHAVSAGNPGSAVALARHGARLRVTSSDSRGKPLGAYEFLSDSHADEQWGAIGAVLDEVPSAIADPDVFAAYAAHYGQARTMARLVELYGVGRRPHIEQVQFGRGWWREYSGGFPDMIRPGINADVARELCRMFPEEVAPRWKKGFLDGDTEVVAVLLPHLDPSSVRERGAMLSAFGAAGDLDALKAVVEWDGAPTRANLRRALGRASDAGHTEVAAWLLDELGRRFGAEAAGKDLEL